MSVFKRKSRGGNSSTYYYYKFSVRGRQYFKCADTPNKAEAEARERLARKAALDGKWESVKADLLGRAPASTSLGEVLAVYRSRASALGRTVEQNINQLRLLCAPSYPGTPVENLVITRLTAAVVRTFQAARVAGKAADKLAMERAKGTANSIYGQARSIFSDDMLAHYRDAGLAVDAAQIQDFRRARMFDVAARQYKRPSIDLLSHILRAAFVGDGAAVKPLKETDPNAYKAFLLCLGLGLRKAAASHARYTWITEQKCAPISQLMLALRAQVPDPDQAAAAQPAPGPSSPETVHRVLLVQIETDFQPKGKDEQVLPLDEFLHSELQALRVPTADPDAPQYILHGHATERQEAVWRRLAAWMTGLGWERRMKAHELRKLYGSEVATAFGLFMAQRLLGHKDPNVTSTRYADMTTLPDVRIFG